MSIVTWEDTADHLEHIHAYLLGEATDLTPDAVPAPARGEEQKAS
ncbi:hypothetical protein SAMN05421504_109135 [Amycolatopsis xylanica]|uniref:Uncharacterized protein n=1 Tax=Amycolatopsis xylanica TaxID=589385 RepID=A0A1H3Q6U1_9PSEU|nr:hypothetical protein [Amycolatopsis xylanica]SDZ08828.1 hypothetical protein SAMN05421504_109135 [Amycolatopsis xylanica]